jgi:hypothetical protein
VEWEASRPPAGLEAVEDGARGGDDAPGHHVARPATTTANSEKDPVSVAPMRTRKCIDEYARKCIDEYVAGTLTPPTSPPRLGL